MTVCKESKLSTTNNMQYITGQFHALIQIVKPRWSVTPKLKLQIRFHQNFLLQKCKSQNMFKETQLM